MACWISQAWITTVVSNDAVQSALVLCESLRRTRSTRKVAVITSPDVSLENRLALRKHFDLVYMLDDIHLPSTNGFNKRDPDTQAKLYCWSMTHFEKCCLVPANSFFLENCDQLFETKDKFGFRNDLDTEGSAELSFFMLKPDKSLWTRIWERVKWNGNEMTAKSLASWLHTETANEKLKPLPEVISEFDVATGKILGDPSNATIVHLVRASPGTTLAEQMNLLKQRVDMGLHETAIRDAWLKMSRSVGTNANGLSWQTAQSYKNEPIAIVGMSCRYPGANTLEEFWNLLYAGKEGIRECPAFRWRKEHVFRGSRQDKRTEAGFLSVPVDEFDARFFGVSPKEAVYLDPQTRLLHEVMWEALEDAGINPQSLYGTHAGIFIGSWMQDYRDIVQGSAESDFFRTYMGNGIGAAAARLSHFLGLTGPSIATESGCSSAIVALDLAVKSLRNGETNLTLAGGVNLLLHPFNSDIMDFVISPGGRCKTFDANADGFGRAEGCGVLVLKRLSDALRDGDNIWAMIRGSAVSQEGVSRSLGTPTVYCEALAMRLALEDAKVSPEQVSFVETHGTGTAVGDPMEVAAIAKAYYSPNRNKPLVIGSVKTNVGHTESCSGITGIMKAVLALQHELIPQQRNLETLNPEIFLDSIPAIIPKENLSWPKVKGQPRLCGVSSFGITGTDGHVVLEEAPDHELPEVSLGLERPIHLMTISGKSKEALEELLLEYENRFAKNTEHLFSNIAYSANVGRSSFEHRACLVASSCEKAGKILQEKTFLAEEIKNGQHSQLCFLFTGQGSQYQGMAKTLYETSPVFRTHFDACDRTLREKYNLSIREILWNLDISSKELSRTIYSQTSIFCVEYCLFKLWQSWGVKPDYVLGHSLGEFCAAVAAEVLSIEDALKLVAERSRLIETLARGSMLVIKASKPEVEKWMVSAKVDLDFAAVNSPEQTVVAGHTQTVETFLVYLKGQGIKTTVLDATHAFHSRHMDSLLEQYRQVAESIKYKSGSQDVQYVSGMEGRLIDDVTQLGSDYWVRHTRERVSFLEACTALRESGCTTFVELGPQPVLSSFVLSNNEGTPLNCLPSLRRGTNDWETILTSLGKLYLLGYQVDWKGYDKPYIRKKVSLPFHPFHRKSFWVDCTSDQATMIHPLVGYPMKNASGIKIFQNDLTFKSVPYLNDHCIGSRIVFPGAGYMEMCLSAGYCVAQGLSEIFEQPTCAMRLENLRIEAPLQLHPEKPCRLQTIVNLTQPQRQSQDLKAPSSDDCSYSVKVYQHCKQNPALPPKWVLHAQSTYIPVTSTKAWLAQYWKPHRIQELISQGPPRSTANFYQSLSDIGLKFGSQFKTLKNYWAIKQSSSNSKMESDEVVAEVQVPADSHKYLLHPLVIDAAFQSGILTRKNYIDLKLKVPVAISQLIWFSPKPEIKPETLLMHSWWKNEQCLVFISTRDFAPVAFIQHIDFVDTTARTIDTVLEQQHKSSEIPDAWEEVWKPISAPFSTSVANPVDLEPIYCDPLIYQPTHENLLSFYHQTERLIYLYILNALQQLGWQPNLNDDTNPRDFCSQLGIQPAFEKLVRFYFTVLHQHGGILGQKPENPNLWTVSSLPPDNARVRQDIHYVGNFLKKGPGAEVTVIHENLAKNLAKILKGEESALAILYNQQPDQYHLSAEHYYQSHPSRDNTLGTGVRIGHNIIRQSYERNGGSNGGKIYRALEVGSGTGSLSLELLRQLRQVWGTQLEMYYTDISPSFFVKAEEKLAEFMESVHFAVLNIEESPLSQGIPLGHFDMVFASDVLHATRDLGESLVHMRQLLKPGGVILFTETMRAATDITFVFGLLEGYWRFEDFYRRPHHCCVGGEGWTEVLQQSGFEEVRYVHTFVEDFGVVTAVARGDLEVDALSVPLKRNGVDCRREWVLFVDKASAEVMARVALTLIESRFKVTTVWKKEEEGKSIPEMKTVISRKFVEAENEDGGEIEGILGGDQLHGVIYGWGMSKEERDQRKVALPFLHIAKFVAGMSKAPQVLVLTEGVHEIGEDTGGCYPSAATLMGMVKSLKNEAYDMLVRYVDLEPNAKPEVKASQVLYELAKVKGTKEQLRVQVAYRGGVRYGPKLVKASLVTSEQELKLPSSTDRFHLKLPETKLIQDLEFEPRGEVESLGDTEVEVKVKAYALNFRDILAIIKPSVEFDKVTSVGLDFSGVVTKVGAEARWKAGDRVFGCCYKDEQLPSYYSLDHRSVIRIPDRMTFSEAVTMPAVFCTAFYSLVNVAKMKKGDRVLIHTGSGGVGLAAIQVAQLVGAEIITTAGNPRKRAYLRSLGIQYVFHSRDTSYEQDIMRVTNDQGVDIVLNSITGPGIKEATLRATAKNGRFVEMSKLNIWTPEEVQQLRPDVDYTVVDLTNVPLEDLLYSTQNALDNGDIRPLPFVQFDALRVRQALQYFQKAKHIGKVVVTMPEVRAEQGEFITQVPLFNSQSTYLISGGLGGIGFEVCKWMLSLGATNIVITGRNPPKPEVAEQIKKLNENGKHVMARLGDIGNYDHVKSLVAEITGSMKPLRGVMHCAGVLRDNLYSNQTWSSFQATFNPKVDGTWNLHSLTRELPLEHFVVYSSIAAIIGTTSQPNHSAANCFEDAFIHYRHSLGLPGTTINWGQWAQVGCAKEINMTGILPVSMERMLSGLETTLKSQKLHVSICDYESIVNFSMYCPTFKTYLDDRLWKEYSGTGSEQSKQGSMKSEEFWREMDSVPSALEKEALLCTHLKQILRTNLRLDADEHLADNANLQELGVDSLMSIELKNSIQTLMGSRLIVTTGLLKNCANIQQIAHVLVGKIVEDGDGDELMEPEVEHLEPLPHAELLELLQNDCVLKPDIWIEPNTPPAVKMGQIRTVMVTGVTGKLAPYVVAELSKCYLEVQKIVCLVRGDKRRVAQTLKMLKLVEIVNLDKIEAVVGDLTQDNLGVPEQTYAHLCTSVDAVIHCAAKMSPSEHLRKIPARSSPRTDSRSINIDGTVNLIQFCCRGKVKHLFYTSTIVSGIFGANVESHLSDTWPDEKVIETLVANQLPGLQTSKWIGEMLLRQAVERGIPGKVFRLPWLGGESKTGRMGGLSNNLYILRFLSFLTLGAMPELVVPAVILPVDICAKLALQLFMSEETPNEIYNVCHPHPQVEQEFVHVAQRVLGKQVDVLEWNEFSNRIQSRRGSEGDDSGLGSILRDQKLVSYYFASGLGQVSGYLSNPQGYFVSTKVNRYIANYGDNLPTGMETLARDLAHLRDTGLLEAFGL